MKVPVGFVVRADEGEVARILLVRRRRGFLIFWDGGGTDSWSLSCALTAVAGASQLQVMRHRGHGAGRQPQTAHHHRPSSLHPIWNLRGAASCHRCLLLSVFLPARSALRTTAPVAAAMARSPGGRAKQGAHDRLQNKAD